MKYVEYDYDFNVYGVPWHFPTPAEVVEKKRGDCKSRMPAIRKILLAGWITIFLWERAERVWRWKQSS